MRADSENRTHRAKAEPGSPEYKTRTAEPTMQAIDAMPKAYREMVHEHGYVDVYLAWKRGMSVQQIKQRADANGGLFEINAPSRLP